MAQHCFMIALVLAVTSTYAFDFQDGNNGLVKWASGCDFYGSDIGNVPGPGQDCGTNCLNKASCTHFTWFNNVCYLKNFGNSQPTAKALDKGVCGWRVGSSPGPSPSGGVQVSFKNNCPHTIWLANTGSPALQSVTLNQGQSYTYNIDKNAGWNGRIWPKYGCDNSGNNCLFGNSVAPCPSGGCQPPADTKVEFNIPAQPPSRDSWYDISLVDGYSLPMKIVPRGVNQGSCIPATCTMSLNSCPSNENNGLGDLRVWKNNKVVACLAPCKKWNFPSPYGMGRNELQAPGVDMCCPTPPISVQQCRSGPVVNTQFVKLIRAQCPSAYSYAYDDIDGNHNCPGSTSYDVTICP